MPVLTGAPRRRAACWRLVGVALLLAVAARPSDPSRRTGHRAGGGQPDRLDRRADRAAAAGAPLTGPTGLELLVSGNLPRLLDIDTGTAAWSPASPAVATG